MSTFQFYKASHNVETNFFDLAYQALKNPTHPLFQEAKHFYSFVGKRKKIVYEAKGKLLAIKEIFNTNPEGKWILFTKTISYAEQIAKEIDGLVFHSKLTKEEKEKVMLDFAKPINRILVSVEALGTGFNMPEIDSAICVAGDSTTLSYIQQLGRIVRFKEDKKAKFINIYCEGTVEEGWIERKLRNKKHVT